MSCLSPSALPSVPKKLSQISKPVNLIEATYFPNDQKENTTPSSAVLSIPFKQILTDPNELTANFSDNIYSKQYAQKLKAFKHILSKVGDDPVEGLAMVDAIQRLGIDYHFQDEIQQILQRQFMIFSSYNGHYHDDLCEVALRFRLLKQHGYYVPADFFNNFKNEEGKLNQKLREDVNGLIAKWFAHGSMLRLKNTWKKGVISSGLRVAAMHIFFLLG